MQSSDSVLVKLGRVFRAHRPASALPVEDLGDPGTLESGWVEGPKCLGHCPSFFLAFFGEGGVQGV